MGTSNSKLIKNQSAAQVREYRQLNQSSKQGCLSASTGNHEPIIVFNEDDTIIDENNRNGGGGGDGFIIVDLFDRDGPEDDIDDEESSSSSSSSNNDGNNECDHLSVTSSIALQQQQKQQCAITEITLHHPTSMISQSTIYVVEGGQGEERDVDTENDGNDEEDPLDCDDMRDFTSVMSIDDSAHEILTILS